MPLLILRCGWQNSRCMCHPPSDFFYQPHSLNTDCLHPGLVRDGATSPDQCHSWCIHQLQFHTQMQLNSGHEDMSDNDPTPCLKLCLSDRQNMIPYNDR